MLKAPFRQVSVVLSLTALLLVIASAFPVIATAQPQPRTHIFHTRQWHDQHAAAGKPGSANNMNYYGGKVMLSSTNYLIFWIPPNYTVSSTYQSLLERYFKDVGGSAFYGIMTQYYQEDTARQYITNASSWGGSTTDETAYPEGRGTATNPLTDADIQAEVAKVAQAKGWTRDLTHMFFVFTAKGVESCIDATTCTPGTAHPAFCAYHGYFNLSGTNYIYANMPYDETWATSCRSFRKSPNNDFAADSEISVTSHEHFEAVTDLNPPPTTPNPPVTAWTDSAGYEIGDKCAYNYGRQAKDGSNITLNGHPYIMQLEWSNAKSGCATS